MKHVMILGCGQLSRLMAQSTQHLEITYTFVAFGNESTSCVESLGKIVRFDENSSVESLLAETGVPDVVTVERESIDTELLKALSDKTKVHPSADAVSNCQHRKREKMALEKLGIAATPWKPVTDLDSLNDAVSTLGFPLVIKACTDGYDGKNQWHLRSQSDLQRLLENNQPTDWIAEPMIDFIAEASIIGMRSSTGEIGFYPITQNEHESGILKRSIAPFDELSLAQTAKIKDMMTKLLEGWQYVGVIAMELFITDSDVFVNELAPRVHNSGHWSQNDLVTSQFENHIRAILGLPLGNTKFEGYCGMVNILGEGNTAPSIDRVDGQGFLYNKTPRHGRKLGHINLFDVDRSKLKSRMSANESVVF